MEPQEITLARAAYARYGAVTEFKNFQGNPMPTWDELPGKIQQAWVAAANGPAVPSNWNTIIPPNPGEIAPAGTPQSKILLPYGGPLFILGEADQVSDGYHTFGELYEHRITLWIALCKMQQQRNQTGFINSVWRSKTHSDGSVCDGWFALGITRQNDEQITYHLPMSKWDACRFALTLDQAPPFDGHTSADVLTRIQSL